MPDIREDMTSQKQFKKHRVMRDIRQIMEIASSVPVDIWKEQLDEKWAEYSQPSANKEQLEKELIFLLQILTSCMIVKVEGYNKALTMLSQGYDDLTAMQEIRNSLNNLGLKK